MKIGNLKFLFALAMFTILTACLADQPTVNLQNSPTSPQGGLRMEILHQSSQCGQALATQWISDQEQLEKKLPAAQRMVISDSPQPVPQINFTQHGVLFLSMGQQRTGGYAIRLTDEEIHVASGSAEIKVRWQEPDPGMMVAQVITHPCVFIKVPRGEYHLIRVIDQDKKLRAEIAVN